ncbi:MvdC/MvdD family ATP grasp protein [Sphaerisporangium sp. NPDC051017]|uniref:MvdC/MvdD family ATP grasp protein n=1 Tax=Sphaerisporangium sp. NPDC051017 TaxID=3154636 RepID=UPI0034312664
MSSRGDGAAERVLGALRRRGAYLVGSDEPSGGGAPGSKAGGAPGSKAGGTPGSKAGGTPVLWWDNGDYPARSRITASFTGGERRLLLDTDTGTIDLSQITAVWRSRPSGPQAADTITEPSRRAHVKLQAEVMLTGCGAC